MLQAAAFLSTFDRFAIAPMVVFIAADLEVSLAEASAAASLYFLLYGCMQPVWGMLSYRLGRVRVIRCALIGALMSGLLLAFAPNLVVLVVARAFAGAIEFAPEARAIVISFFANALFVDSGLAAAPLAGAGCFSLLFALAAIPLGLLGSLARRRYVSKAREVFSTAGPEDTGAQLFGDAAGLPGCKLHACMTGAARGDDLPVAEEPVPERERGALRLDKLRRERQLVVEEGGLLVEGAYLRYHEAVSLSLQLLVREPGGA